jgi:hypothetical protein
MITSTSFDAVRFEDHIEDQLQVPGVQGVFPRSYDTDKFPTSNYQAIEQGIDSLFQ